MLTIVVLGDEFFDNDTNEFMTVGDVVLELEHSLVSLSKWESIYEKPFLGKEKKSPGEIIGYIKAMILTPGIGPEVLNRLSADNLKAINDYIESKNSATTFGMMPEQSGRGETITSELIYYWMVAFTIPFECENWHLNRLFSLIRICNIKNGKPKKMGRHELASRNRMLNEQRRAQLSSSG